MIHRSLELIARIQKTTFNIPSAHRLSSTEGEVVENKEAGRLRSRLQH